LEAPAILLIEFRYYRCIFAMADMPLVSLQLIQVKCDSSKPTASRKVLLRCSFWLPLVRILKQHGLKLNDIEIVLVCILQEYIHVLSRPMAAAKAKRKVWTNVYLHDMVTSFSTIVILPISL